MLGWLGGLGFRLFLPLPGEAAEAGGAGGGGKKWSPNSEMVNAAHRP
jgi:hypothetical protein